ncbi:hypothetical protein BN439_3232 [Erwinia amylovora Ea644]|nr:hypothetical protein BN439_3232 [Erwinia amylovora Ea644]CCP08338.1 hypothetical protein BN440_3334 [Erwinia amylovora MR1]
MLAALATISSGLSRGRLQGPPLAAAAFIVVQSRVFLQSAVPQRSYGDMLCYR